MLAYDVTAEAVSGIVGKGAQAAAGPAEVFQQSIFAHSSLIFPLDFGKILFFLLQGGCWLREGGYNVAKQCNRGKRVQGGFHLWFALWHIGNLSRRFLTML